MSAYLPPPTNNHLDQEQRLRLVKSTRKLAGLLGEVPRVAEPRSSTDSESSSSFEYYNPPRSQSSLGFSDPRAESRASKRSGRMFSPSRSSFISFEDLSDSDEDEEEVMPKPSLSLSHSHAGPNPNQLFLQLNTHSVLDIGQPDVRTPMPPSPLSPLTPGIVSVLDRRRQMAAKLCRTLGETVPPELVQQPRPPPRGSSRSHSHDESHTPSYFAAQQDTFLRDRRPSNIYQVVNVHIPSSVARPNNTSEQADTVGELRQGLVKRNPTRRAGKEWSGEWNHDMNDVMSKLRGLK